MFDATVDDVRARYPAGYGAQARLDLGHHARLQRRQQLCQRGGVDLADQRVAVGPAGVQTLDIGQHHQLLGVQRLGQCRGRRVGVDVVHDAVGVWGDRRDHRDTPRGNQIQQRRGVDAFDIADQSDVGGHPVDRDAAPHRGEQCGVFTGDADGVRAVCVDQVHQFPADLAEQHHPGDVEHLRGGDPETALEIALDAKPFQHRADLRAAAVYDYRVDAAVAQEHHVGGERRLEYVVGHRVAAVLDHDDLAVQSFQPR